MNHNIVCIKRSSSGNEQYEDLDLVMALASLDYHIHLVFYGDAICSLLNMNLTYNKRLQALPLFDIDDIWVDDTSLNSRKIKPSQLPHNIKPLSSAELKQLFNNSLAVYTL